MNKKCRIEIFDILKGIAVLAVIAGHVAQTYHMDRVMQFMYSFHMPMFFMISGYFIRTDEDDARFIKRKAKSLLCPYGIACLVLIMAKTGIALIKGRNALGTFGKWCYVSLYGTGSGRGSVYLSGGVIKHTDEIGMLWFLLALFWAVVITKKVLRSRFPYIYVAVITVCGILSFRIIQLPWSLQNGMAATVWIYLGFFIKGRNILSQYQKITDKSIIIIVSAILWGISILWGTTHLYENYYKLGIIDMAGAMGACMILFFIMSKASCPICKKALSWTGRNSLIIYIVHFWEEKIAPGYSVSMMVRRLNLTNLYICLVVSTIVVFGICAFCTYLYFKTKKYGESHLNGGAAINE